MAPLRGSQVIKYSESLSLNQAICHMSSQYWTRATLQLRLVQKNIIKKSLMQFAFEKIPCICKLGPVEYHEHEYGGLSANLQLSTGPSSAIYFNLT